MSKITCCKDCTKRYLGCHDECTLYKAQRKALHQTVQKLRKDDITYKLKCYGNRALSWVD